MKAVIFDTKLLSTLSAGEAQGADRVYIQSLAIVFDRLVIERRGRTFAHITKHKVEVNVMIDVERRRVLSFEHVLN